MVNRHFCRLALADSGFAVFKILEGVSSFLKEGVSSVCGRLSRPPHNPLGLSHGKRSLPIVRSSLLCFEEYLDFSLVALSRVLGLLIGGLLLNFDPVFLSFMIPYARF
jgi:hypothetical protein